MTRLITSDYLFLRLAAVYHLKIETSNCNSCRRQCAVVYNIIPILKYEKTEKRYLANRNIARGLSTVCVCVWKK